MSDINLIHGDCLIEMQHIPDKSIDMVLCDLPYGTTACKWDVIIPFNKLWEQYRRIVKNNGAIVLFGSQPFTSLLISSNLKGFKFAWVWDKKFAANFALKKYQPQKIHEDIVVFTTSGKPPIFNAQLTMRSVKIKHGANKSKGVLRDLKFRPEYDTKIYDTKQPESIIHVSSRSEKRGFHPTQKPLALLEYLIKTYSNEGDTILDNTMGSGSTMVACERTNRNGIGIELEKEYFEVARRRVDEAKSQHLLLSNFII